MIIVGSGQPGDGRPRRPRASGLRPTNAAEANGLYQELRKILNHIGMAEHHVLDKNFYTSTSIPIAGVAHQAGTCRFGNDPATSVLDANCKAHERDAIRVGEHLLIRMS